MRSRVIAFLLMGLLFCSGLVMADPAAYTGVVSIDTVTVHPGDHFSVPIRLKNNNASNLSLMFVPLKMNHQYLTLDSISLANTIVAGNFWPQYGYDTTTNQLPLVIMPNLTPPLPVLNSTGGVLARLYITIASNAPANDIAIDSVCSIPGSSTYLPEWRVAVIDSTSTAAGTFYPDFVPGLIHVMVPTGVDDHNGSALPKAFALDQNYPNPFNPSTTISYSLPTASSVKLEVFNVLGQQIAVLADGRKPAGEYSVKFDASKFPSGIYFYRLTHDNGTDTKKMVLLK